MNNNLIFKFAAMNAGKTLSIIATYYSYKQHEINTILIKPGKDTKGNKNIISRNGSFIEVDYIILENDDICQKLAYKLVSEDIQCIIADEAQFFTKEQIEQLTKIVDYHHIDVICYGLRTDFRGNLFPGSKALFEKANIIMPLDLQARCRCGEIAIMNTRKINGNYIFEGDQVAIDGKDNITYQSLCRKCYNEEKKKYYTKIRTKNLSNNCQKK